MNNIKIEINDIENKNNKIFLNDILLSSNNPRYTLINNAYINLIDFLKKEKDEKNQQEIFIKLLKNEGNFNDLIRLLNNIYNFEFNNLWEPIYLIQNENKYIVAEGNRRIMTLNLILNNFHLPDFDKLNIYEYSSYSNNIDEKIHKNDYEEYDNFLNKAKYNYDECKKIITKIQEKYLGKIWTLYVNVINDSEKLWQMIYDKHLTGERPGIRQWSRTKYFADLLSMFPEGINFNENNVLINEKIKFIFQKIKREPKMVINDFHEAQYIYSLFYFYRGYNDDKEEVDNFNIKDILEEMISLNKPSALERIHSFNKIKRLFCIHNVLIDENKFDEEYIRINFSKVNHRIEIKYKLIKPSSFFIFIIDKWLNKELTTRPFKNESKILQDFQSKVLDHFDFSNKLEKEELRKVDEFQISLESLNNLIKANEPFHDKKTIEPFKKARNLRLNIQKFLENNISIFSSKIIIKDDSPEYIFVILLDQLKWNFSESAKTKFLNAASCTIRSFFEQLILWAYINYYKEENKELIDVWCTGNVVSDLFRELQNSYNNKEKKETFKYRKLYNFKSLNDITLSNIFGQIINNDKNKNELIKYIKSLLLKDEQNKNKLSLLNEAVHASHRFYFSENFCDILDSIHESFNIINNIISYIDFNKLNNLNSQIFERLKEKNK